jgi:serine/threonine protein kinase
MLPIKASDIWALGASLHELITGNFPFGEMGGLTQKSGVAIPFVGTKDFSPLQHIITLCLQQETWNRPTAKEIQDWCEQYFKKGKIHLDRKYKKILKPSGKINKKILLRVGIVIIGIIALIGIAKGIQVGWDKIQIEWTIHQKNAETERIKKLEEAKAEKERIQREAATKAEADKLEKEKQEQQEAEEQQAQAQKQTQIADLLSQANIAFDKARYDEAFKIYLQVKNLGSNDKTGYNYFLGKAKELKDILGECDDEVNALLHKAQQLYDGEEAKKLCL